MAKTYLEMFFYYQLIKITIEYINFETITRINYVDYFEQDKLHLTFLLSIGRVTNNFDDIGDYFSRRDSHEIEPGYDYLSIYSNDTQECMKLYNISDETPIKEQIISYLNCHRIDSKQLISRNIFFESYINETILIDRNLFVNNIDFKIGYIWKQITDEMIIQKWNLNPILTVYLNPEYGARNKFVSLKISNDLYK